jgi:hypothetical protein
MWVRMRACALGYIPPPHPGLGNALVSHRSIPFKMTFLALAKIDGQTPRMCATAVP